ncbi:hypothetical protein TNIN_104781 [Trichonephila inaurata madagascariensis]|uniref:Uncharacterized protein n=1 Tax=Trichonephila inaurata madagascariensis TaxID=2747483 RepID=A0A8X6X7J8_9ARAC|nr:hypothetical protein TNIN_104781 [Trichonephila inaurata madagascariensis]
MSKVRPTGNKPEQRTKKNIQFFKKIPSNARYARINPDMVELHPNDDEDEDMLPGSSIPSFKTGANYRITPGPFGRVGKTGLLVPNFTETKRAVKSAPATGSEVSGERRKISGDRFSRGIFLVKQRTMLSRAISQMSLRIRDLC